MENNTSAYKWLLVSQNIILFGSAMVFPYYIIFIKQSGANFTQFGFAYALFAMSSALVRLWVGKLTDRFGRSIFLAFSSWGMAFSLVFFPSVTSIYQLYILQVVMGICNAFQKTAKKALVADMTLPQERGKQIGIYHMWTSLGSALAVIIAGYVIDIVSLNIIFYASSLIMFIGGFASLKIKESRL